ncbi:MAG: hypothetical protein U1E83_02835 [Methylotetracoccus sp.]
MSLLARHPFILFGAGVVLGYVAHKYRGEIIAAAQDAAEKSREVAQRQRDALEGLFSGADASAGDADA